MPTVLMRHPDFPERQPVEVTEMAFDNAWEKKGWELVNPYTLDSPAEIQTETGPKTTENIPEVKNLDEGIDTSPYVMEVDEGPRTPVLETMPLESLIALANNLGIENADDMDEEAIRGLIANTPDFYGSESG